MSKNKYLILSVVLSVVFVAAITYGATTISTNINTGGTLTVSGVSTLTGAVYATSTLQATGVTTLYDNLVVDTDTLFVDSTNDRVGIGTSSPMAFFSVGEGTGTVTGDVYLTGGLTVGASSTINSTEGTILLSNTRRSDPTGTEGMLYYQAGTKVLRMYEGASWFTIGTSTSGLTLSGNRLQLSDLNYYMTFGTTTQQSTSTMMTIEATSTVAIPLTLVARASQTANTFQINDAASAKLLYVDSAGGLFGSSTAQFTGKLTTYGNVTLGDAAGDAITLTGNASTTNALTVGGNLYITGGILATAATSTITNLTMVNATTTNATTTTLYVSSIASTTGLIIGGGSTVSRLVFGYCTIPNILLSASTTAYADCDSTTGGPGIQSSDRVTVTATSSLPTNFIIQAASSTKSNNISVRIYNTGWIDGVATTTGNTNVNSFNFIGVR